MHNQIIGRLGEQMAQNFLISQNYEIIKCNYHCRYGEIDIISKDPAGSLIFIEVKCRSSTTFGEPQESITFSKKQKLKKTVFHFLSEIKHYPAWRFDAIFVKLNKEGKLKELIHLKNIF